MHRTLFLLALTGATPAVAQQRVPPIAPASGWSVIYTASELTGEQDVRLIRRASEWPTAQGVVRQQRRPWAALVLACGNRIANTNGLSLFLVFGQAITLLGGDAQAIVDYRFDRRSRWVQLDPYAREYKDVILSETDWRDDTWVLFISDRPDEFFSRRRLRELMAADTLHLRFRGTAGLETATIPLVGFEQAVRAIPECATAAIPQPVEQ